MNWIVAFSLVLLAAIYFPTAAWLRGNYVPPRPGPASVSDAGLIVKLERPFVPHGGYAFWAKAPGLASIADTKEQPQRSPVLLYENDTLLGPAHRAHDEISVNGGGFFSHWGTGVVFSSKNREAPGPKGKTYWLVVPKGVVTDPPRDAQLRDTKPPSWPSSRQP